MELNQDFKPTNHNGYPVVRNSALGFTVLFGVFFMMLIIVSLGMMIFMGRVSEGNLGKFMKVMIVLQDILVFILPAIVAAIAVTRLPAQLLGLTVKPKLKLIALSLLVLATSIPAIDWIAQLNASLQLPESMAWLQDMLSRMEDDAASTTDTVMAADSIGGLIVSVLIMGVLAGFSEELFFRGALQGLLFSTRVRGHLAVWLTAIIFSFMHFQFFGFVPRLLLGVYFGYLLWWTGSLWIPVIAHAFNNSLVVITEWLGETPDQTAQIAEDVWTKSVGDWLTIALSFAVTALGIIVFRRVALSGRIHKVK